MKEEAAGVFIAEGHSKDSLLSFVNYALSFQEIQSLLDYEARSQVVTVAASEDDQLVGFGSRAKNTWREIWDSRDDGYAAFILKKMLCFRDKDAQATAIPAEEAALTTLWLFSDDTYVKCSC